MTTTIVEGKENREAALDGLRAQATGLEQKVNELAESLATSRLRCENLIAERGSLVVAARSQKNNTAQKRLNAIDEQLIPLKRNIQDDGAALAELSAHLVLAQNDVERAEWELRRAAVRKLIEERLAGKTAGAIEKAVNVLENALRAAKDEDELILSAMVRFEPRLGRETRPLRMATFERARLAAYKLKDQLPVDSREFGYNQVLKGKEFGESDRRQYGELLQALDRLELVF